jgi:hypothetical protein
VSEPGRGVDDASVVVGVAVDAVPVPLADALAAATAVARKGRRRRNTSTGPRTVRRVVIRLSEHENGLVSAMAVEQGVTAQALFMRALLTGGTDATAKYERLRDELAAARRLLAAVSVNINQLARQANAAGAGLDVAAVTDEQMATALRTLARAVEQIDAVTAAAGNGRPPATATPHPVAGSPAVAAAMADIGAGAPPRA